MGADFTLLRGPRAPDLGLKLALWLLGQGPHANRRGGGMSLHKMKRKDISVPGPEKRKQSLNTCPARRFQYFSNRNMRLKVAAVRLRFLDRRLMDWKTVAFLGLLVPAFASVIIPHRGGFRVSSPARGLCRL